jgi:N-acetylneuraminic acid mutarotase
VAHSPGGGWPESPLSGAILRARTSKPGFQGAIRYLRGGAELAFLGSEEGEVVDLAPGVDIEVFASGLRGAFDLVSTQRGRLYAVDRGAGFGLGAASVGPTAAALDPDGQDELVLVERGAYYGHPNRNRGRLDARQNIYRGASDRAQSEEFSASVRELEGPLGGLDEYRASAFQGALRGDLLAIVAGRAARVRLSEDGRSAQSVEPLEAWSGATFLRTLPGGAFATFGGGSGGMMQVHVPDDPSALGLQVLDIFPARAPLEGGTPFVVSGVGFGTISDTSVRFGGIPAVLTSVSPTRIRGRVPAFSPGTVASAAPVAVSVSVAGATAQQPAAFRYLGPPGSLQGTWTDLPNVPVFLGEVAAGVIGDILYLVGGGSAALYRYDLNAQTWLSNGPGRPFAGDHHAAEAVNGKLYLISGLGSNSEGKVQIYDPATNQWTLGPQLPWAGGSLSTALIGGKIYAAGGIVGSVTVNNHAVLDPAGGGWVSRAPMPVGRNHTAAGTDGTRFYVFGGRDGPNIVTNGFDDVQVYHPATDTWQWSGDGVSGLAKLPQFRGGMGKAAYFQGEFYVFGGETSTGPGAVAGKVYDRVDVYRPGTNTWRLDTKMPHPRHGIFPIRFQSRIYLPAGGVVAGTSASIIFDAFLPP